MHLTDIHIDEIVKIDNLPCNAVGRATFSNARQYRQPNSSGSPTPQTGTDMLPAVGDPVPAQEVRQGQPHQATGQQYRGPDRPA